MKSERPAHDADPKMPPASTNGSNGEGSSHQSSQPESPRLIGADDDNDLETQDYDLLEDDFLGEDAQTQYDTA